MSVTREIIYNEVWAEPMIVVAARYEVSGNFLARVCQAMNVPRPPRGYWAKLRAGKAPKKPKLPAATGAHATEWTKGAMPFSPARPMTESLPPPGTKRRRWARPGRHPLVDGVTPLYESAYVSDAGYSVRHRRRAPSRGGHILPCPGPLRSRAGSLEPRRSTPQDDPDAGSAT